MDIKKRLPEIKENVLLSKYTTFKIGGPAEYFFVAKNQKDLIKAIKAAKEFNLPFFILGQGSNLLVSDNGFKGLVIQIKNLKATLRGVRLKASRKIKNCRIYADAGVLVRKIIDIVSKNNLTGFEWAAGIPGTIGGAVYGNIGAFGSILGDNVENVKVLNIKNLKINHSTGLRVNTELSRSIKTLANKECKFGNKDSVFKQNKNFIILSVLLKLKKGEKEQISQKIKRFSIYREKNHPLNFPSAGCIFKNYNKKITNKELLKKYPELIEFNKGSRIPTSYLIDKCGLKGKKIGKAQISEKHANFIINLGGAKSEDVVKLIKIMKQKVKNKFNVKLEEEIQYLK